MEIINAKAIRQFAWILGIITIFFTLIFSILYFVKFHGSLSDDQSVWGTFGDYIGGTVGTLFNLLAVVLSVTSIYITLRVATRIHEKEVKFNADNLERESLKFEREIELVQKQNKPFPVVGFNRYFESMDVTLSNQGPGILIVNNITLISNNQNFSDFKELLNYALLKKPNYQRLQMTFDAAQTHVLISGASVSLFKIEKRPGENTHWWNVFYSECTSLIEPVEVEISYEDIFEKKFQKKIPSLRL